MPPDLPQPPSEPSGVDPRADEMFAAARRGSNRAWAALVERLDPAARRLAHLILGGHGVDDVLLDAYVRAYRSRRTGGDDATVHLLHHAWTACGHELRRRRRRQEPAPGRRAQAHDWTPRLGDDPRGRAVAGLQPEERAVWHLVDREGLSTAVTALALGVDEAVVDGVADRVRSRLDRLLAPGADDGDDTNEGGRGHGGNDEGGRDEVRPGEDDGKGEDEGGRDDGRPGEGDGDDGRDDEGAADGPGGLDPEPPGAAFWARLGSLLRAERDVLPAAGPPTLPEPGDPSPALTSARPPPVAMQKRAPARSRRGRPDLVEGLAGEAERQRPRRDWRALAVRAAVVVLAGSVIGGILVGSYLVASRARSPVRGDTVASLAGRSMSGLGQAETWAATVERTVAGDAGSGETVTVELVAARDGSYRLFEPASGRLTTYDASTAVLADTGEGRAPGHERGLAPGPPDPAPPRAGTVLDDLVVTVRALAGESEVAPTRVAVDGRSAWRLTGTLADGLAVTYVVDAERLAPLEITWTRGGATVRSLRFRSVAFGAGDVAFSQDGASTATAIDHGFVPVPIGEVQGRIGLGPLTPDHLPEGFEFTGAAVHERDRVAALRYARGPLEIVVTVRPSPVEAGRPWDDPFPRDGTGVRSEAVTLGTGPFRDVAARQVSGGVDLPSIWGADGDRAFTVAGDLSPDDLQRVARSLG